MFLPYFQPLFLSKQPCSCPFSQPCSHRSNQLFTLPATLTANLPHNIRTNFPANLSAILPDTSQSSWTLTIFLDCLSSSLLLDLQSATQPPSQSGSQLTSLPTSQPASQPCGHWGHRLISHNSQRWYWSGTSSLARGEATYPLPCYILCRTRGHPGHTCLITPPPQPLSRASPALPSFTTKFPLLLLSLCVLGVKSVLIEYWIIYTILYLHILFIC